MVPRIKPLISDSTEDKVAIWNSYARRTTSRIPHILSFAVELKRRAMGHDPLDLAFCCIFLCAPIAYGFFDIFGNNYASLIDTTATTSTSMSTMFIDSDEEYYRTTRRAPTLHCNYPSKCCPFSRGSSLFRQRKTLSGDWWRNNRGSEAKKRKKESRTELAASQSKTHVAWAK